MLGVTQCDSIVLTLCEDCLDPIQQFKLGVPKDDDIVDEFKDSCIPVSALSVLAQNLSPDDASLIGNLWYQ